MSVVERAAEFAPPVLEALWRTSWQVALIAGGVLALELVCGRRLTARWRYRLWLLVFVRLLLPAPIAVQGAVVPWTALATELAPGLGAAARPTESFRAFVPATVPPSPAPGQVATPPAPSAAPPGGSPAPTPAVEPPVLPTGSGAAPLRAPSASFGASGVGAASLGRERAAEPSAAPSAESLAGAAALGAWIAGALVGLTRLALGALGLRRRLRTADATLDPSLAAAVERATARAGLRRPPRVRTLADFDGPAVVGALRPTLVLPPDLADRVAPATLERVLLHELFHVRARDVAVNLAAAALGAVFWFHPLVHLARARLRACQESARDWQALDTARDAPTDGYARALVDLAHARRAAVPTTALPLSRAGRDLERRILMIDSYRPRTHRSWLLGAPLAAALVWLGFTDATGLGAPSAQERSAAWRTLQVERVGTEPAWADALRARLDRPFELPPVEENTPIADVIESARVALGINVVLHPEVRAEFENYHAPTIGGTFTGAELFDLLVDDPDLEQTLWCVTGHAVYFVSPWYAPEAFELRLYGLGPLLERGYAMDELIEYVQVATMSDDDVWGYEHVALGDLGRALTVRHTPAMHARVTEALERLLNEGRRRPGTERPPSLLARIANERVELRLEDTALREAVGQLSAATGVPIRVVDHYSEEEIDIALAGVPGDVAVGWLARTLELAVVEYGGAIVLTDDAFGSPTTEFFELGPLARLLHEDGLDEDSDDWAASYLSDLIQANVAPGYWDSAPEARLWRIGPYLIARAPDALQAQIADLTRSIEAVSR